jgi:hypothetical protein
MFNSEFSIPIRQNPLPSPRMRIWNSELSISQIFRGTFYYGLSIVASSVMPDCLDGIDASGAPGR